MSIPIPQSPEEWLKEIEIAYTDAAETKSFAALMGTKLTDKDLFQLAPLVCLKFRGKKLKGKEQDKVVKGALTAYVANSEKLGSNPKIPFSLCYIAAHVVLDLVDEQEADEILVFCEKHLEKEENGGRLKILEGEPHSTLPYAFGKVVDKKTDDVPKFRPSVPLKPLPRKPETRQKVGRNAPCPCGSGKKFKNCCMR